MIYPCHRFYFLLRCILSYSICRGIQGLGRFYAVRICTLEKESHVQIKDSVLTLIRRKTMKNCCRLRKKQTAGIHNETRAVCCFFRWGSALIESRLARKFLKGCERTSFIDINESIVSLPDYRRDIIPISFVFGIIDNPNRSVTNPLGEMCAIFIIK